MFLSDSRQRSAAWDFSPAFSIPPIPPSSIVGVKFPITRAMSFDAPRAFASLLQVSLFFVRQHGSAK
jgi:hypothetical protein